MTHYDTKAPKGINPMNKMKNKSTQKLKKDYQFNIDLDKDLRYEVNVRKGIKYALLTPFMSFIIFLVTVVAYPLILYKEIKK